MNLLIHWKEEYDVNIKSIDQQHRKLVDMINVLYDSLIEKKESNIVEQIILDMMDYAFIHFKEEEKYFALFGFEGAPAHIEEHLLFIRKIEEYKAGFKLGNPELIPEILSFLKDWLLIHILGSDKKYVELFIANGVK